MSDVKRRSSWVFRIPGESVELTTHGDVWSSSLDLDAITAGRCRSLGNRVGRGAWFFCPKYTVYSPTPSADFFRVAREARSHWLMQTREVMGQGDPRREKRNAERQGRRAAFLELDRPADMDRPLRPPEVIPLDSLSPHDRTQVILGGMLAKGWAMTGVLFIDGEIIPPATWHRIAEAILDPADPSSLTTTHRHLDLAFLKATGNPEPLRRVALSALKAHLAELPGHAVYVAPHLTLSTPSATPAFYRKAMQARDQWGSLLNRTLGCVNARCLRRAVDPETFALAFVGVLFADGQLYWPGCWPNQPPNPKHLKRSPARSPIVPPEFFGARMTERSKAASLPGQPSSSAPKSSVTDPSTLNDQFIELFGSAAL